MFPVDIVTSYNMPSVTRSGRPYSAMTMVTIVFNGNEFSYWFPSTASWTTFQNGVCEIIRIEPRTHLLFKIDDDVLRMVADIRDNDVIVVVEAPLRLPPATSLSSSSEEDSDEGEQEPVLLPQPRPAPIFLGITQQPSPSTCGRTRPPTITLGGEDEEDDDESSSSESDSGETEPLYWVTDPLSGEEVVWTQTEGMSQRGGVE